jgi:hypothetical protein
MAVNRTLGVNAAIVLKYGDPNQATIKGLNQLTLPSLTRSEIVSEEFGVDFAVIDAGGGKHGPLLYSGNLVFADVLGQVQLLTYLKNNTKFTDARVYVNIVVGDFLMADIASDSEAGFQVLSHTPGQTNKNGTFPISGSWAVNGLYAYFFVHRPDIAAIKLDFVASDAPLTVGGTITDSTNQFLINGFLADQTLIVEGSTSCDGTYLIRTAIAGVLTLEVAGTNGGQLVTEASPGAACILHGGSL